MTSENSTKNISARLWLGLGLLPATIFSTVLICRGITLFVYSDATPDGISDFGPFFDLLQGLILLPGGIITMVAIGLSRTPQKVLAWMGIIAAALLGIIWSIGSILIIALDESLITGLVPGLLGLSLFVACATAIKGWRLADLF